jgi:hypothetical protein
MNSGEWHGGRRKEKKKMNGASQQLLNQGAKADKQKKKTSKI